MLVNVYCEGAFSSTNERTLHLQSLSPVFRLFFLLLAKICIIIHRKGPNTLLNIIFVFDCKPSQSFCNLRYGLRRWCNVDKGSGR